MLLGSSIWTKIFFIIAAGIVFIDLFATLFSIIYQRIWYEKVLRPKYDESFSPRCSIVVPCKNVPKDFRDNLQGFLEQGYDDYEVIFVVESENDPATPIIRSLVENEPRARFAVAGLSTTCAQKNHNMLAAIRKADNPDVFVFADADIRPRKEWLKEIILPLSSQKVTVTSGFRWLTITRGSLGELAHSYVNIYIYILFSAACFFGGVGLWGGSMAMRRKDFEELDVAKRWSKTAVDDISLSQIVMKNSRKAIVVPSCITHSDDLIQTVGGTISWFERQTMFLKSYYKPIWFFLALPGVLATLILIMLLPYALLLSLFQSKSFFGVGGGAALLFYVGEFASTCFYPLLGPMARFHRFLIVQPLLRVTHMISFMKTCITNTITWAGIKYHIGDNGEVDWIVRPNKGEEEMDEAFSVQNAEPSLEQS